MKSRNYTPISKRYNDKINSLMVLLIPYNINKIFMWNIKDNIYVLLNGCNVSNDNLSLSKSIINNLKQRNR